MGLWLVVLAAVLGPFAYSPAARADPSGPYAGMWAGPHFVRDSDVQGSGIDTSASFNTGWGLAGSFGYRFPFGLRAEAEGGYRRSEVDSLAGVSGGRGSARALSLMLNAIYEFDTGTAFTPYLGVGAGGARIAFDGVSPIGASRVDDTDTVPALQGLFGVSYNVSEALQVFADYRYFNGFGVGFTTDSGRGVDAEYGSHAVLVGFRWSFGHSAFGEAAQAEPRAEIAAVPRAAAPAPAPAEAKPTAPAVAEAEPARPPAFPLSYLVFFEWDRADLTPEGRDIVRIAADNALKGGVSRIDATGHADRSGPAEYNVRLSKRRAEAVKAELIRLGVPEPDIAMLWRGEREPLVATADGVREAKNRRVEIVFN